MMALDPLNRSGSFFMLLMTYLFFWLMTETKKPEPEHP